MWPVFYKACAHTMVAACFGISLLASCQRIAAHEDSAGVIFGIGALICVGVWCAIAGWDPR